MNQVRSSFGIELEGYIAWVEEGVVFQNPSRYHWNPSAGPIILPAGSGATKGVREWQTRTRDLVYVRLTAFIMRILTRNREHVVVSQGKTKEELKKDGMDHLEEYRHWKVVPEYLDHEKIPESLQRSWGGFERGGQDRGWVPFELCSPALLATNASYDEVRNVIRTLNDNLWILTPRNCGLHVHYGNGSNWLPLAPLRRLAGLMYAADALLVQLHPRRRRTYEYCRSNVMYSQLAHGATAADAKEDIYNPEIRYEGAAELLIPVEKPQVEAREEPRSNRPEESCCWPCNFGHRPVDSPQEDASINLNIRPGGRRGSLGTYPYPDDFEHNFYISNKLQAVYHPRNHPPEHRPSPYMPIPDAVRELLKVNNSVELDTLFDPQMNERPAYNSQNYGEVRYITDDQKRTIEFRQGAGVFDGDVVTAWCKIVVGLSEWAAQAPLGEYWKVILDCTVAAETQHEGTWEDAAWYDAFDLLVDTGLSEEGRVMYQFVKQEATQRRALRAARRRASLSS